MEASRRRVAIFRRDGSAFAYVVLLVVSAVDAAGYSLIAPVGPAIAASTGVSPSIIGLLVATFPLGIMVGFIVAAVAVQRGRTHVALVTSLAIVVVGSLGFVIGQRVDIYFASRFVMGVGSGAVWIGVAFNIFARCPGQESRCMSRIFAAYSVGGLLGPIIGATGGVSTPFGAYAVIELICIGLVVVMGPVRAPASFATDWSVLRAPLFWVSSGANLFAYLALGMIEGVLPLHLAAGLSQASIGLLYASMAVVAAVAAGVAARFAPRRELTLSLLLVVLGIAVVGAADHPSMWVAGLVLGGIGFGLAITASITLLLDGVATSRIVAAMVVWSQVGIVGYLLGPLVGGISASAWGYGSLGWIACLSAAPVALLLKRSRRPSRPTAADG